MGSTVMLYVLPMMLGQTYDLGKERPGLQIFPQDAIEKATVLEQYFADTQYRMIDDASQVKEFMDVSGKLSLKIKGGMVDASGEGSYVKDFASKKNTFQILVKVHYETVTKTIPYWVTPNAEWTSMEKDFLGTHYCRSITYGGDLIAAISISAENGYDMERIKGAINGAISVKGGAFEATVKARLDKLKKDAQDKSSLEINYFASVPLEGVSYTVEGLLKLVREFPEHVKKVNGGMGNPLRMELYPLNGLEPTYKEYIENRALGGMLDDMDTYFDDLRATRRELARWTSGLPPVIPKNVAKKIEDFQKKVTSIYGVFLKSIDELDLSKDASTKPVKDALNAYKDGDYSMPQKYIRKLTTLKQDIYRLAPALRPLVGGALFVRWGQDKCSGTAETVLRGVVSSSESNQDGGSTDLLCMPLDPANPDPKAYFPGYEKDDDEDYMLVSPVMYTGSLKKFKDFSMKYLPCAVCRQPFQNTVLTTPGSRSCPSPKWTKNYEGVVMAPGIKASKAEYVCMDKDMKILDKNPKFGNEAIDHLFELQEVTVTCGGLPCDKYPQNKAVPCVVCSI